MEVQPLSDKKRRALETMENLLSKMPAPQKLMLTAFLPQFRLAFEEADEAQIDRILDAIKGQIRYIETGEESDPEV